MSEELPEGWANTTLGELGTWHGGGTPSKSNPGFWRNGSIPWVSPKDMKADYIDKSEDYITEEAVSNSSAKIISKSSILVVTRSGILQRILPVAINTIPVTTNQDIKSLSPFSRLSSKFIAYFLKRFDLQVRHDCAKTGTTVASVDLPKLKNFQISLPPLNEQKRIVNKIESLQARSQRARVALAEVGPLLEQFRQSVLAAAFRGDLTADWRAAHPDVEPASVLLERIREERRQKWEAAELARYEAKGKQPPKGWKDKYKEPEPPNLETAPTLSAGWAWAAAEEITKPFRPVIYGIIKPGPDTPGGVPYVRVTEMKTGTIDVANLKRCHPDRAAKFKRAELLTNDILVSKDGTIGKVALVPPELEGGNITQHVLRVSISDHLDPEFVALMIQSPFCQGWMTGELKGIALQGVNVGDFRLMPIPLATREEQEVIVKRTQSSLESITQLEDFFTESKSALTQLDQSILSKAFRGELVPQDPEDEPAAELLARIQAARTAEQATQKKRTTRRKTKTATAKKN